jgi:hypothetical protein
MFVSYVRFNALARVADLLRIWRVSDSLTIFSANSGVGHTPCCGVEMRLYSYSAPNSLDRVALLRLLASFCFCYMFIEAEILVLFLPILLYVPSPQTSNQPTSFTAWVLAALLFYRILARNLSIILSNWQFIILYQIRVFRIETSYLRLLSTCPIQRITECEIQWLSC